MKKRTAEEILQEIDQRKARILDCVREQISNWAHTLEEAQAAAETVASTPENIDQYALAMMKVQLAEQKKTEAEQLLYALENNQRSVATADDTEAYLAQIKKDAIQKLLDNCQEQIKLRKALFDLEKKAAEIQEQANGAVHAWYANVLCGRSAPLSVNVDLVYPQLVEHYASGSNCTSRIVLGKEPAVDVSLLEEAAAQLRSSLKALG